jgi:hypothetical protein
MALIISPCIEPLKAFVVDRRILGVELDLMDVFMWHSCQLCYLIAYLWHCNFFSVFDVDDVHLCQGAFDARSGLVN